MLLKAFCTASKLYVREVEAFEGQKCLDVKEYRKEYPAMQKIPLHLMYYLSTYLD